MKLPTMSNLTRLIVRAVFFVFLLFPFTFAQANDRIIVIKISGAINPVVAEFVSEEIEAANREGDHLAVLEMDTPGGLDTSMRMIIKSIQSSRIPVVTFVSPQGSRAASAGTFIAIASHIAAMAPGTNIGAAHPVNVMGGGGSSSDEEPTPMEDKVLNDASAYIRSLAESRGRNAHWAELAVRKSVSISALEAKKLAVIDLVANNIDALLLAIDGREVTAGEKPYTIKTVGKQLETREMTPRQQILDVISNPNIAYILMMIGMVGIYFELSSPGLILPGIIGGISIILALYGMQSLPVNYAGLLLMVLGVTLFIAELNFATFGLLSLGGAIALFLGSVMLIDSDDPAMQISKAVLIPTLLLSILAAVGTLILALRSRNCAPVSGVEGMMGTTAEVKTALEPEGLVWLHGESWKAKCEEWAQPGETVVVEAVDGLTVKVKRLESKSEKE
jgi:membrane-bound serine protease (ClpP class)